MQAQETTQVKVMKGEFTRDDPISDDLCDQVSRDDEEYVYPNKAAAHSEIEVKKQYEDYRDGA